MKKILVIPLVISVVSIAVAFYMEYVLQLYPCNLCLAQRFSHYLIIATSILALLTARSISKGFTVLSILATMSGLIFAGRQIFLQRFASNESMGCGIDLVTMFENFAPTTALKKLFEGTTDCAQIDWSLFGLSIADYSAILFIVILVVQLWSLKNAAK